MGTHKKKTNSDLTAAAKKLGSAGGKIGGRARAESLSAAERSAIAKKAALARWGKAKLKQDTPKQKRHNEGKDNK